MNPMADGLLLLDKQAGETSTGCVEKVWKILGRKSKVGHGGTLDSPASGLLVILVGAATRTCSFVQNLPKTYDVEAQLGAFSDTDDATGNIQRKSEWKHVSHESIEREMMGFLGMRLQVPPSISAVHVAGRRAHELARSGERTCLSSRPVTITSFSEASGPDPLGRIRFKIQCHKGTYVRSLVRDLGNRLCCGAYVVSLKRLSIGRFNLEDSLPLANLTTIGQAFPEKNLLPLDRLLDHFVTYRVPQELEKDVRNGRPIPFDSLARAHWGRIPESGHVALRAENLFCFALPEEKPKGPCCYRPDVVLALGEQR